MAKAKWSNERIRRLFLHYNAKYWGGRLSAKHTVVVGRCQGAYGIYHEQTLTITIDAEKARGRSDRHVRGTLLHEMIHAAVKSKPSEDPHGYRFWQELERLLQLGAPLMVQHGEAPNHRFRCAATIPRKFPLARAAMKRHAQKENRESERWARRNNKPTRVISDEEIIEEFQDAAIQGLTWSRARLAVGLEYGLLDIAGNPINKWADAILRKGKGLHRRVRADELASQRYWAELSSG